MKIKYFFPFQNLSQKWLIQYLTAYTSLLEQQFKSGLISRGLMFQWNFNVCPFCSKKLEIYINRDFDEKVDKLTDLFCTLPPPHPTGINYDSSVNQPKLNMRNIMDADAGCILGTYRKIHLATVFERIILTWCRIFFFGAEILLNWHYFFYIRRNIRCKTGLGIKKYFASYKNFFDKIR